MFKDIGKATKSAVKATGKATKTAVKATGKATKTAVKYVGDHEQDIRKVVKNPIVKAGIMELLRLSLLNLTLSSQ